MRRIAILTLLLTILLAACGQDDDFEPGVATTVPTISQTQPDTDPTDPVEDPTNPAPTEPDPTGSTLPNVGTDPGGFGPIF